MEVEKLTLNVAKSTTDLEVVNASNIEISNAVNHTQEITRKSNETANSISAVAEEQTAMIHDIADSSRTLAELAGEMQSVVAKFKL